MDQTRIPPGTQVLIEIRKDEPATVIEHRTGPNPLVLVKRQDGTEAWVPPWHLYRVERDD